MMYLIFTFLNIGDLNNFKHLNKNIDKIYNSMFVYLKEYRKHLFFNLNPSPVYWIYTSINSVTNTEQCNFIAEKYCKMYDKKQFISYIQYNLDDFNQIQLEIWLKWIKNKILH